MGDNSNGFWATSTSSNRDASLSRPSTAQSNHQQDIPSFSAGQTYMQMLTKRAFPSSKSSTNSTTHPHNQGTRRDRQRSPIRQNSRRRSRSPSKPHHRTYKSYVPDFNNGDISGPFSGAPSSRGVASTDRYRPSYVPRPNRNDEEFTRREKGSYVALHNSNKEHSPRTREGSYVDPWNCNIEPVPPASTKVFGRLSPLHFDEPPSKRESRNPHWGQLLKGFKQHLERPPLEQGKERKRYEGMLPKQENKVVVMKVEEDEGLVPAMSWHQRAEKIRKELRQQQTTIMM